MNKLLFAVLIFILSCSASGQENRATQPGYDKQGLVGYLRSHSMTPTEYVVSKFGRYDIVFLGEEHYIKQNLEFVQELIPALYRGGIYNLGIEFGVDDFQPDVDRLITADHYEEDLARKIMFKDFVIWANTDYMDIYRKAWEFNHSLAKGAKKFRVVNLNYRPDWSALQGPRTHEVMDKVWFKGDPDVYMGNTVLHEFADKHEKALVYAGFHHTFTHYHQPYYDFQAQKLNSFTTSRMGNVVYDQIPSRVFLILLHAPWTNREGWGHWSSPVGGAIEAVMQEMQNRPVGFDVEDSPFGKLRDPNTYYSIGYPGFTLATITDGYIFLVPFRKFQSVTVDDKFITTANLQEAIANFWDPELREKIKTPQDLLQFSRDDAEEVAKFREVR